jgi:hypothetical protein
LSLWLLTLIVGCGGNPHAPDLAEVSGKVLFQGQPLPGGQVSFVAVRGGFASSGTIDENGSYQIKAPVGEVNIGVDNSMLQPPSGRKKAPKQLSHPKPPGATVADQTVKGRWLKIPYEYADPGKSGLRYTVTSGSQTHDITLTDPPSLPAGTSGP